MRKGWSSLAPGLAVLALTSPLFAGPPPTSAMLSSACAGCHGTNGVSAGPSMPSIAGQPKIATVEAMQAFKSGERPSTVMGRLAKGYGDADFEAMGEFFAKQRFAAADQKTDQSRANKGKALHEKHCKRCHLENGKEFDENASIIGGQWLTYLQIQMDDYASGKRRMSEKKAEKMKPLTREELDALAHFYAAQR
jgi:sulfide dehydrogenase cytochrome subunit